MKTHPGRSTYIAQLLLSIALLLFLGLASACQRPGGQDLQSISLPMGYVANVQFSPFYVAKELGYFAQEGFDVTFDYRWETDGIQLTASGEVPFTVASGDQIIQARSHGLPVIAIAGWYQRFPVAIISLEGTPLDSPQHLRGLRIGIPETFGASYIGLRALLEVGGLTEEDIELQTIGYTQLAALTNGTVDAVVVYANNEPVVLAHQGVPFNMLKVADYVDLVSAVIASSDAFTADEPESVKGFVRAFLRGLSDTLADPDAAFETSKKYVEGLEENAEVQRAVLTASIALWQTPTPGMMQAEPWARAQDVMLQAGLIERPTPVDELFTNAFIEVP
ncbi:MAG TPA: myristoyl transferase [Chloroflexi bacterium]|nr:myristoyl transferase [Chloroflexota bacterium]